MGLQADVKDAIKLPVDKGDSMLKTREKRMTKFLTKITTLEPLEIIGVARFFNIPIVDEQNEPRLGEDILNDILNKFESLSSIKQKRFMEILKKGTK